MVKVKEKVEKGEANSRLKEILAVKVGGASLSLSNASLHGGEDFFTNAKRCRRHFQKFVFVYEIQGLFEAQNGRRSQLNFDSFSDRPIVGKFFCFADIDFDIKLAA